MCLCVRACVRACVLKYIVWMEHEEKVCFELCFTNETHRALSRLRGMGLNLTDNAPLIKETLVRYAVGLEGDLPQLAQMR